MLEGVVDRFRIPARRHSSRKQGLHFRCEIDGFVVKGIEQRLDTKSITGGEQRPITLVPKGKGELAPQSMQALGAEVLVKVQDNLTV